jgi:hypothetical protein
MRKRRFEVTSEGELEPQRNSFPAVVPLPCPALQRAVPTVASRLPRELRRPGGGAGDPPLPASLRRKPWEGARGLEEGGSGHGGGSRARTGSGHGAGTTVVRPRARGRSGVDRRPDPDLLLRRGDGRHAPRWEVRRGTTRPPARRPIPLSPPGHCGADPSPPPPTPVPRHRNAGAVPVPASSPFRRRTRPDVPSRRR